MHSGETAATDAPGVVIRPAREGDGPALQQIDVETYSLDVTPTPPPQPGEAFWGERTRPEHILVAETGGVPIGYIKVAPRYRRLASGDHVHQIWALAVSPLAQGHGVGRQLVTEAGAVARDRGAERLTLNVLGTNAPARRLYERCGFTIEGVLCEQFRLGGQLVDDMLLALDLRGPSA